MTEQARIVLVTAPNESTAEAIAKGLVAAKLAACVNVVPGITSHYSWRGRIHKDREFLLIAKSRAPLLREISAFVRARHPAAVPEIIAVAVCGGDKPYLNWLRSSTKARPGPRSRREKGE